MLMRDKNKTEDTVSFKLLCNNKSIQKVHSASLRILETVGVRVMHDGALNMLERAGAKVDHRTKRVLVPSELVEQSVERAPKTVIFGARNPKYDLVLRPDGKTYTRSVTGSTGYIDLFTGKYREILLSDVKDWARLVDTLGNVSYCAGIYPSDVPEATKDISVFMAILENTEKHIQLSIEASGSSESLKYIIKLALTIMGGKEELRKRPIFNILNTAFSPLQYPEVTVDTMLMAGEYGIPVELATCPVAGATGPVSLAGTVLLANVELLAGLVIAEVANPGTPVVFAPRPYFLDMREAIPLGGCVESAMVAAMQAQVLKKCYNIPTCLSGLGTDAMTPDEQSMIERVYHTLLPALAGVNILATAGLLERAYTVSPVQLLIDNEILGMTQRILKGFNVNDDSLGIQTITKVGAGGHFLEENHTLKYFKTEYLIPNIFNRMSREKWERKGIKDFNMNVKNTAMKILKEHRSPPLDESLSRELRLIVKEAEKSLLQVKS